MPAPAKGTPQVLSVGNSGASVLVWATSSIYQGFGPLTIDTIYSGPRRRRTRTTVPDVELLDSARDSAGQLDLLVARKPRHAGDHPALALYRARQDGGVRRVWSGGTGGVAVVTHRDSAVAVAWLEQSAEGAQIKLTTARDGLHFTSARTVSGVLPRFPRIGPVWAVNGLDLTFDGSHRPVLGVTISRSVNPILILATLTAGGRARTRQVSEGVDGLVQLKTSARGRVGVMVDDTGIEGEGGECVGDHDGRRLFATTRESSRNRFLALQRLDAHPLECGSGGAQLETVGDRVLVLWTRPGDTRMLEGAAAGPAEPFGTPAALASGAVLRAATDWRGQLAFASIIPGDSVYAGPLAVQVVNASGVNPREPLAADTGGRVLMGRDPSDIDMLVAWQRTGSRDVQLRYLGGQ